MQYRLNKFRSNYNWRTPILSELTLIVFNMYLTHLDSEASNITTDITKLRLIMINEWILWCPKENC